MRISGPRHRSTASTFVVGLVATGFGLAGCGAESTMTPLASSPASALASTSAGPTPSTAPTGPATVGLEELDTLEVALEGGPDWPTLLEGSVWVLAPDGPLRAGGHAPLVYRLDATSGEEQARVPVDGRLCQGMAAVLDMLWACSDGGLTRIDPATNAVAGVVPFDVAQVYVRPVVTEGRIWMLGGNVVPDQLIEIDAASRQVVATHPLGHEAAGLATGEGALWATVPAEGLVLRIDPSSAEVTVHAEGLPAPVSIAIGAGSLWVGLYSEHGGEVAAPGEPTITRLSAADGSVQAEFATGTTTMLEGDIWAGEDAVWVRTPADPFLVRIDPASNQLSFAIAGFYSGGTLTVADGVVWVTSTEFSRAWRIEP